MDDFLMGFGAQRRQHEAHLEELQRGGRVIGSPMSPTPEPDARNDRDEGQDYSHGAPSGSNPPISPKKKKKKKHHRKNLESDAAETSAMAEGDHAPSRESKKKHKGKKKSRSNKTNGVHSPDAQHVRGSPPSAQQPTMNGIAEHASTLDTEAVEQEPSSMEEVNTRHLKTEPDIAMNDVPDHELPFRIADNSIVDGPYSRQRSPFIHKRRMSIADGRSDPESDDEAPIPDLHPSQVKPEPPSSESESDFASPSVARLARLSRSRSRSVSRPPPLNNPTDGSLNLFARAASITPSRSSTGSNESIPARTQEPRPVSRASAHSSSGHDPQLNGDAMDVDDQDFGNGHASPPKKQARRPKSARKPKNYQQIQDIIAEASGADEGSHQQRQGHSSMSNKDVDKVSDWLAQPARRRTHADVVEESDHEVVGHGAEATQQNEVEDEGDTEQAIQQQLQQQVHAHAIEAPAANEAEVSKSCQPKKSKKRRLQSKDSLSLSQLEDDFGESENQPRMSLSQKSKLKDVMRGDRNGPEEDGPSQEPALPKQTKPKRKRRTKEASEDEMENLLAGPSRRKKSKKSGKTVGTKDDENAAVAPKTKRRSKDDVATGPWTTEELTALGHAVDQFRRAYDMDQQEVNAMIHERPDQSNPMHKEFWDDAVAAIPNRNRKQIVERTRRLYNNFVGRGRWSDEQKTELHELFDKHGTKFAEISSMINRDQKDIRDYWRNHYVVHENQRKYYWQPEETEKLRQAVEEALNKIRVDRENNDQFRPRPRAKGFDDESLLDWQQISAAIATRSRQQCKWKWQELKEQGAVGEENDHLPEASRQSRTINGLSEVLANAREDYRVMSVDDQLRLVEALHDSSYTKDSKIKWHSLVDEHFRAKWRRPTMKLVWFRLRKSVPDHEDQDVQSNARYLINYYNSIQSLPRTDDHQADDQVEEKLVNNIPGSKVWRTPSQEPRAVRERQRRSSSASSRASSRPREKVSSQILNLNANDGEQHGEPSERGRNRTPRSGSVDLGQEDGGASEEQEQPKTAKRKGKSARKKKGEEVVPVRVPKHLNGEAAEQ